MRTPALRAALRIARRDAMRSRGRSILVVAMIGLPILGLSTAAVLARTAQLSPTEEVNRELGAADARVMWTDMGGAVEQDPRGLNHGWNPASLPGGSDTGPPKRPKPQSEQEFRTALPAGSTIVSRRLMGAGIRTKNGVKSTGLEAFDYAAAPVRGLIRQVSGRSPRTASEVALTRELAKATGLRVGDTMTLTRPEERDLRIVGLVEDRYALNAQLAFTVPDAKPGATEWYVDTPRPLSWPEVMGLNAKGYVATSRDVVLHPPPRSQVPYYAHQQATNATREDIAVGVLVVGMALLEVVLLAGPAFAVGARRRRRELALVAATGGDRRDVRNIVLAGGAVLGLAAAVAGVVAGVGLAAALLPTLERLSGSVAGHFDVRPLELAGAAFIGVVTGLIAALLPARAAARQDVVAALAGRRGTLRTPTRVPVIGLIIALAGTVLAVGAAALMRNTAAVLAGAVIAEIGLIMCTPTLLGWVGRLGRRLPLSPRLALRDAARNRSSATPAIAAIMAAVAGSVGIGIVVASLSAHDRANYQPSARHGDAVVQLAPEAVELAPQVAAAVRSTLPTQQVVVLHSDKPCTDSDCHAVDVVLPPERACPADKAKSQAEYSRLSKDPRCENRADTVNSYVSPIVVDDGNVLPTLTGAPAPDGVAALHAGKAVVFNPQLVKDGKAIFTIFGTGPEKSYALPAIAVTSEFPLVRAVVPATLARQLGIQPVATVVYAHNRSVPTEAQEQALQGALDALGENSGVIIERGYVDRYNIGLLALVIAAAVITLGAATIATALANVDSRPDLVTLAAVGASPRVRRVLSMSRAGVIAVLGSALGVMAGFVPAVGFILVQRAVDPAGVERPLTIPWLSLSLTAIVVPLLAVGIAGLFSRSRLPIERRMAT